MKKKLRIICGDGDILIMSEYTGEVCYPWQLRRVFSMIRDFNLPNLW